MKWIDSSGRGEGLGTHRASSCFSSGVAIDRYGNLLVVQLCTFVESRNRSARE